MTLRKLTASAAMMALAAAFMLGTAGVGEAAKKKAAPKGPSKAEWCNFEYKPVCGVLGGKKRTFSNACWAKREGAKHVKPGACK